MRPPLAFETSSDCDPRAVERGLASDRAKQSFVLNGAIDEEPYPQLYPFLRLLFILQGATMQLPSLSLLAIVNDRVAIPPAYLPAYSAVAFLPHSLKPVWATLSTIGADATSKEYHIQKLLGILLAANGLTYLGTALWIPVGGVVECFVWGFLRGVTEAWSQFLTDQLLILQAQDDSDSSKSPSSHAVGDRSYQAVSSIFQSHAATYSSSGSVIASVVTFAVFTWRQVHKKDNGTDPPLSDGMVFVLLLASACTCLVGAVVVFRQVQVGTSALPDEHTDNRSEETFTAPHSESDHQQRNKGIFLAIGSLFSSKYDALPTGDDAVQGNIHRVNIESPSTHETSNTESLHHDTQTERVQNRGRSATTFRDKSDIACLVLLQLLLVGGAAKGPVDSLDEGPAIWTAIMILLSTCFLGAAFLSSCLQQGHQQYGSVGRRQITPQEGQDHPTTIPPRRLGLYLMLRHSVPIAGILMYSYIYAIFGREEPVFLQCLFVIESVVSVLANWTYGRFLAESFHSGWKVMALIAILSVVASLVSLLDVIVVHVANAKDEVNASLRWLVVAVSVVSYFMGQIGYMPSVILATANVVSVHKDTNNNAADSSSRESILSSEGRRSDDAIAEDMDWDNDTTVYDEGIQYATFVACIDFGAQMGDWISVPIIAAFGIERENHWANLDNFIVLCAMLRIASVAFLYIIRPIRHS